MKPAALALASVLLLGACSLPDGNGAPGATGNEAMTTTPAIASTATLPSASSKPSHSTKPATLTYGPGPVSPYTVQPQPEPGTCHYRYTPTGQPLPDQNCTPGALNPKVTEATLDTTICRTGYTKSIRPPQSITREEKALNAESYGYSGSLRDAEYDHLVPLELGGDPNSALNLWVEPPSPGHRPGSGVNNKKDGVESKAKTLVCDGQVPLADMQLAIATNWTTALQSVGQ